MNKLELARRVMRSGHWSVAVAFVVVMTVIGVRWAMEPQVVLVERGSESWIASTFHTGNIIVDNKAQFGPTPVPTNLAAYFSVVNTAQTTQIWSDTSSPGHVGFGGNNEDINVTLRQTTTFDTTTSHTGHATGIDIVVSGGHSAGTDAIEVQALAPNAVCADSPCTAYSFKSLLGIMENDGAVNFAASPDVQLGFHVEQFEVPGDTTHIARIGIGALPGVDGSAIQTKNTLTGSAFTGIEVAGDTTITAAVVPAFVLWRGAGGGFGGSVEALVGMDSGSHFLVGAAANDMIVANETAGKRVLFSADGTGFTIGAELDGAGDFAVHGTLNVDGRANFNSTDPAAVATFQNGVPAFIESGLDCRFTTAGTTTCYLNYEGYLGGLSQFRNLCVSNGKGASAPCLAFFDGTFGRLGIQNNGPATALDVTGMIQSTLGFDTSAGIIQAGLGSTNPTATIDPANGRATFAVMNVGFGNQPTPLSPVDIQGAGFGLTTEQPLAMMALITGGQATYDVTAQDRRAYGMFYDGSQSISAGSNILTGIGLRLDENMGGHAVPGSQVHPLALWLDEGELWLNEHTMFTTRPAHLGVIGVSSCGTGTPTVAGNDGGGRITVGGGAVVSCTLSFQIAWADHTNTAITPTCMVQAENGAVLSIVPTTSSLVITGTMTGTFVNYRCAGADNALPGP